MIRQYGANAHHGRRHDDLLEAFHGHGGILIVGAPFLDAAISPPQHPEAQPNDGFHVRHNLKKHIVAVETTSGSESDQVGVQVSRSFQN